MGRSIADVVGKEVFDMLHYRFEQALNGEDVTFETDANYDVIGMRRISAAYKPTPDSYAEPDGWLAFVDEVTDCRSEFQGEKTFG